MTLLRILTVSCVALIGVAQSARAYDSQMLADCLIERANRLNQEASLQADASLSDTAADYLPAIAASGNLNDTKVGSYNESDKNIEVTASQKILDASLLSAIDAGKAAVKSARLTVRAQTLSDANTAVTALVELQRLYDQRALLAAQMASFNALARILSVGNRVGLSDSNDLLQAQASLLSDQSQIKELDYNIENARATFQTTYGFSALLLADVHLRNDETVPVERLPNLKALQAQVEQIEAQKKQAEREAWPQLSVQGSYTTAGSNTAIIASNQATAQGTLSLVVNLSGLWKTAGRREAFDGITQQRKNQLRQQLQDTKNIYAQIDQELGMITEKKPLLQERLNVSLRSREVSKAKLRLGRIGFLELQQSEESVFSAGQDEAATLMRERQLRLQKELALIFVDDHPRRDSFCVLAPQARPRSQP